MNRILSFNKNGYDFLELLLDERLCAGDIYIPEEFIVQAGGVNTRLRSKRKYELILRIAESGKISFDAVKDIMPPSDGYRLFLDTEDDRYGFEGLETDCYIISKYSSILMKESLFDLAVSGIMAEGEVSGRRAEMIAYLEAMLRRDKEYYYIDDFTKPVLIFKGNDTCYNVLNNFADSLGAELNKKGVKTEFFNVDEEDWRDVERFNGRHYKAVIGFQSYLFSVKMKDGKNFFADYIKAPKFNMLLDHPIWFKNHLEYRAKDFTILTHDENYKRFLEKYYGQKALILAPAGNKTTEDKGEVIKKYDLSFVGSYGDYRPVIKEVETYDEERAKLGLSLFEKLKYKPYLTFEAGFSEVLKEKDITLEDEEYLNLLYGLRKVLFAVSYYFREKIIKTILENGITLHVFGESFKRSPLTKYPNLCVHKEVSAEKTHEVYEASRISLNLMTWHKAGFTERMAGIMLSGAHLLTEHTEAISGNEEFFTEFTLSEIEKIPDKIKGLLSDKERCKKMAESGRKLAELYFTWETRADRFLEIIG